MMLTKHNVHIEYFRSSGPGGQHKNKRLTAVTVTHIPTGISATSTQYRSQLQNKKAAFEALIEKIRLKTAVKKQRIPTGIPRSVKEKILETKRRQSCIKQQRRRVSFFALEE